MIDAGQQVAFHASPWKLFGLGVLGIGMTALSAAVAIPLLGNVPPGSFAQFVGYVGVVFFALCTVLIFRRAATMRGPVVTMAPEGIRDIRIAPEFIPWPAIQGMWTWSLSGQKILILAVDPAVRERLTTTRIAKWTRGANAALGADGVGITAQGLAVNYDTLMKTVADYWDAARSDRAAG